MSRRRSRALIALLVGFALVVSACGDDDDTSTSGSGGTLRFEPYDAGGPLTEAALEERRDPGRGALHDEPQDRK